MNAAFIHKSEIFEGPLPLLLSLIEKRKLHISEVSLALIADEYIAHLEAAGKDEESISEFLSIMSTLLLIKARALLPGIELSSSEEDEVVELEEKLRRYQILSRAASLIRKQHVHYSLVSVQGIRTEPSEPQGFRKFRSLSVDVLREAALTVSIRIPRIAETYRNVQLSKRRKLESVVREMIARINTSFSSTFSSYVETVSDRADRVVHFLALLELVRCGMISASQRDLCEEIYIEKVGVDIPRYGA